MAERARSNRRGVHDPVAVDSNSGSYADPARARRLELEATRSRTGTDARDHERPEPLAALVGCAVQDRDTGMRHYSARRAASPDRAGYAVLAVETGEQVSLRQGTLRRA